jgi:hypothetical protein
VSARPSERISADQIRQARKLLGWHRGDVAIRARGITGNTVGKAEGAFPGSPPTPEQLQEIRGVLEAAGIESPSARRALSSGESVFACRTDVNEPNSENDG